MEQSQTKVEEIKELEPLSKDSIEKVNLIRKILEKETSDSEREKNFNILYDKSLSDLRIYYNIYYNICK